jgi:protein-disulfide isomerase
MAKKKEEKKEKDLVKIITPIFIVLLIVTSFLGGSLVTQLKFMGKGEKEAPVPQKAQKASPTTRPKTQEEKEEQETVLEAEDLALIEDSETVKGNPEAPITIVEFSEYQCPYCKRYVDETYGKLWDEYGDKIRYIFRDYPLPFHQHAQKTAEAARCGGEQDKYWEYHDLLFERNSEWASSEDPNSVLNDFAKELGLDTDQFSECLSSGKYTQAVKDDFKLGQRVGVSGTPSFFINGRLLVGAQPFENFKVIIEEELSK